MTMQQVCETIAYYLYWAHGKEIAPKDIYEYSPPGELSLVFALYEKAAEWLGVDTDPRV